MFGGGIFLARQDSFGGYLRAKVDDLGPFCEALADALARLWINRSARWPSGSQHLFAIIEGRCLLSASFSTAFVAGGQQL